MYSTRLSCPAQRWVVTLQQPEGRSRPSGLAHDPVGGVVVAFLDHQLHVAPALRAVDELPGFDLVEEGQREIGFDHARRLQGGVLVDAGQLLPRGEVVDQPGGALVAVDRAAGAQRFDVSLDLALEFAIDGAPRGAVRKAQEQDDQNAEVTERDWQLWIQHRGSIGWPRAEPE